MKNRLSKILSILLSLTLFFSTVNLSVLAQDVLTNGNISITDNISIEEYNKTEEAQKIYNSLSKEAKEIFDGDIKILISKEKYGITPRSAVAGLADLGLPTPVLYSLQGMMAGFTAAAADGPLPFGDAVLIATSVAAATTIAIYWYDVAPKWEKIITVFKQELGNATNTITKVFSDLKNNISSLFNSKITNAIINIDENKKIHILQDKHNWSSLVPNPKDPKNWDKIKEIIKKVMEKGKQFPHKNAQKRVFKINDKIVEVSFIIKEGVIRISNAWVKK